MKSFFFLRICTKFNYVNEHLLLNVFFRRLTPPPTPYFCTLLRFSSPSRVLGKGKETAAMQASQYHQVCPQARELYSSLCISQPTQLLCQVHSNSSTIIHLNQLVPKNKEIQWTAACDPSFHLTKEALMPSQFLVDYFQP